MEQHTVVCAQCGLVLDAQAQFCRDCGKPVTDAAQARFSQRTMVGVPLAELLAQDEAEHGSLGAAKPDPANRVSGNGDGAAAADSPAHAAPNQPTPHDVGFGGKTLLGVSPLSTPPAADVSSNHDPYAPDAPGFGARTMRGVSVPDLPASVMPTSKVPRGTVSAHGSVDDDDESSGRAGVETILGSADAGEPVAGEPVAHAPSSRPHGSSNGHSSAPFASAMGGAVAQARASGRPSARPSSSARARSRGRGPSIVGLFLAALGLVAAGALGYVALHGRGPEVRVHIESTPEGEVLVFQVPGAPKGARLRFGGQERVLELGQTRFALGADSLRVGKNAVLFDVVYPDGRVDDSRVTIQVDYRVTLDTGPLRAGHPAVDVVVVAVLGSQVWLDGEQIALDAQGRGVRRDAIDPELGPSGQVEHRVRYRIEPPSGEVSVGELRTVIPMTTMQIDRPGPVTTTDQPQVEIAGVVDKDASLTLDGKPVEVAAGRFLIQYPLPAQGEYQPRLVAMAPGKAPRTAKLILRRVNDLVQAAEGYNPDLTLTYARISQSPTTYRGQRVALEGRIYNVKVEGGRSTLQVLVRDCSKGDRCPLWVTYGAATEFTVDSWVRVLGTVEGEQQFRSETDEVKTVPKVDAAFLLHAQP